MVPSSLCAPSNSCFLDLHHETSDELVERLVSLDSALSWHLRLLDTEEDAESDLLSLTVTGWSGAEANLSTTPAKVSVPDAVLAWQRMPRQPPVSTRHGRGDGATSNASPTDERRSRADAASVAMGDRGALPSAECDDDADEDEYVALVEASGAFDGALGDGAVDDILEDLEKESMGNESQAPEQPDEDIFGDRGPDDEDLCASLRQAHADTLQAELASVGVEGRDNSGRAMSLSEHIAPSSPPRASSSTAAMPIAPVAPPAGDASATPALSSEAPVVIEAPPPPHDLVVSDKGYVADGSGRSVGRITYFGRNISCKCAMHPKCTNVKTIQRATQESMLAWLARGRRVPWDAPESEKAAALRAHQADKVRQA